MASVVVVIAVVLAAACATSFVVWRRSSLVPRRGTSIGADLGALADRPRVRVRAVTMTGTDRVRLILQPEASLIDDAGLATASDLDLVVSLGEGEFGFDLLHEWKRSKSVLALVMPPESRLVRLRSLDGLQPLTLHRVDQE